jgi:hypothetical protein
MFPVEFSVIMFREFNNCKNGFYTGFLELNFLDDVEVFFQS